MGIVGGMGLFVLGLCCSIPSACNSSLIIKLMLNLNHPMFKFMLLKMLIQIPETPPQCLLKPKAWPFLHHSYPQVQFSPVHINQLKYIKQQYPANSANNLVDKHVCGIYSQSPPHQNNPTISSTPHSHNTYSYSLQYQDTN